VLVTVGAKRVKADSTLAVLFFFSSQSFETGKN